jgi:glycerate-2-kinase
LVVNVHENTTQIKYDIADHVSKVRGGRTYFVVYDSAIICLIINKMNGRLYYLQFS